MSDGRSLWWSGRAAGPDLPWREIVIGSAGGALLGRLLCGGARGVFRGGTLGAAAGAAFGLLDRFPSAPRAGAPAPSGRRAGPPARPEAAPPGGSRRREARSPAEDPSQRGATPAGDGSGAPAFESWTRAELYEEAQRLDIAGRSGMNKAELLEAVRERHG